MNEFILNFLLKAPGILIALTVHEFSHGWIAFKNGDTTAKDQGRLTLNPISHLDPIGTIMLFLFNFGWAKPVPVNANNFRGDIREVRRRLIWVSFAGPASNIIFGALLGILLQALVGAGIVQQYHNNYLYLALTFTIFINFILALFNLIPIPPLDGSHILSGLLPERYQPAWERFASNGFLILIGVILISQFLNIPIFWTIIGKPSLMLYSIFTGGSPIYF